MIAKEKKFDAIPFFWIVRLALYLRTTNKAETIIALRKLGIIALIYAVSAAWWFIGFGMGGIIFPFIVNFWMTVITGGVFSNLYSRAVFTARTWEHYFYTPFRIPFKHAPDLRRVVITKSFKSLRFSDRHKITLNEFPLGWSIERGFVWYGFRRPFDPPEVYRHHIAFAGEYGIGTEAMRDLIAMRAFEISPDNLFIILDSDTGGMSFDTFEDKYGFVVYKNHMDCMKSIHYVNQELLRRRAKGIKRCTQIIIMADATASTAFIGRSPAIRRYKPVAEAIRNIVTAGKSFGVHLVLFPPPDFYENATTSYPKHEFSRHNFQFAQYYSTEFTEVVKPDGTKTFKAIDAPAWGVGLFNWTHQGQKILVQDAPPNKVQVMHRINKSLQSYPVQTLALWDKFKHFDFGA